MALTLERLKEVLHYDPCTGVFTWLVPTATRAKAGDKAGCLVAEGYIRIRIDSVLYYAHRLAWFYVHGNWPLRTDHKLGNKADNRISKIRDVTPSGNNQNQRTAPSSNKSTGVLGVSYIKANGRFRALIKTNGKPKYLGYFDTVEEAYQAYVKAKRKYHKTCTI